MANAEYYLPIEGLLVAEAANTEHGPEIQRIKQAQIVLNECHGKTAVIYLSDYRDATGRSLETAIADHSVALHQLLDEAIKRDRVLPW